MRTMVWFLQKRICRCRNQWLQSGTYVGTIVSSVGVGTGNLSVPLLLTSLFIFIRRSCELGAMWQIRRHLCNGLWMVHTMRLMFSNHTCMYEYLSYVKMTQRHNIIRPHNLSYQWTYPPSAAPRHHHHHSASLHVCFFLQHFYTCYPIRMDKDHLL